MPLISHKYATIAQFIQSKGAALLARPVAEGCILHVPACLGWVLGAAREDVQGTGFDVSVVQLTNFPKALGTESDRDHINELARLVTSSAHRLPILYSFKLKIYSYKTLICEIAICTY